jgi:hypothetical protein
MPRSASSLLLLAAPFGLVACAPQDAEVTGDWFVWLAANSSNVVATGDIVELEDRATVYECADFTNCAYNLYAGLTDANREGVTNFDDLRALIVERDGDDVALRNCAAGGWDTLTERWYTSYHGPQSADEFSDERYVGGSCAYNAEDDGSPARDDNGEIDWLDCGDDEVEQVVSECGEIFETRLQQGYHNWMTLDGFYAMQAPIEPWRTHAMINGEGHLQLTIHFNVDNEDVYFSWTIDPDFDPVECITNEEGVAEVRGVDGGDWLGNWSDGEDDSGHTVYYLNAGAQQVNGGENWFLTTDWLAGFGHANFIGEEMYSEPPAYGNYDNELFTLSDDTPSFLSIPDRNDLNVDAQPGWADVLRSYADLWEREMVEGAGAYASDTRFEHRVEDNLWRAPDETVGGLDGWMELHSSWVRVKDGAKFEKGGTAEGDFQILFGGAETSSRMLVKGTFKVDKMREDRWAYPVLEDELREQNGTPFCK